MQVIMQASDFDRLEDNLFLGTPPSLQNNASIAFAGKNNVLLVEPGVKIEGKVKFQGDNSLVVLSSNKHTYFLNLTLHNNCSFVIGSDNYLNGTLNVVVSEERHVLIGSGGLYSFGIWIRTADPHLVYDSTTLRRINPSKDVLIGDHVWLGQSSLILKGTTIGSGSIVGAMGVVAGKTIPSNTSWAGNPAKQIASDIFWDGRCVHSWTKTETAANQQYKSRNYIYKQEGPAIGLRNLANELHGAGTALERANLCEKYLLDNSSPNRFAINATATTSKKDSRSPFQKILKK